MARGSRLRAVGRLDELTSDAPTPTEQRALASPARRRDTELDAIYRRGVADGRREARSARRSRVPRRARSLGTRAVVSPLRRPAREGLRLLGITLGLVALYLVTDERSTRAVTGVVDGARRALDWLFSPERGVPYFDAAEPAAEPAPTPPASSFRPSVHRADVA